MGMAKIYTTKDLLKVMQVLDLKELDAIVSFSPEQVQAGKLIEGSYKLEFFNENDSIWTKTKINGAENAQTEFWQNYNGVYEVPKEEEELLKEMVKEIKEKDIYEQNKAEYDKLFGFLEENDSDNMDEVNGDIKKIVEVSNESEERLEADDNETEEEEKEVEEVEEITTYHKGDILTIKVEVEMEENGELHFKDIGSLKLAGLDIIEWEKGEVTTNKEKEAKANAVKEKLESWKKTLSEDELKAFEEMYE